MNYSDQVRDLPTWYIKILCFLYKNNLHKKKKLKSGRVNFKEKRLYYGETVLISWFEVDYSGQTPSKSESQDIIRTIQLLEFVWNLQTILIMAFTAVIIYFFIKTQMYSFYLDLIFDNKLSIPKVTTFNYVLEQLYCKQLTCPWFLTLKWINTNLLQSIL